jgi:hypothetical protein
MARPRSTEPAEQRAAREREQARQRMKGLRDKRREEQVKTKPDRWYVPAVIATPRGRIHRCADEGLKEGDYV